MQAKKFFLLNTNLTGACRGTRSEELGGGVDEDSRHWAGMSVEEGHAVDDLVTDLAVGNFPLALQAAEDTAVVREVVLDRRVDHLHVVKAHCKVEDLA